MRPLGKEKTRKHVEGHQDCAICHPSEGNVKKARQKFKEMDIMEAYECVSARHRASLDKLAEDD